MALAVFSKPINWIREQYRQNRVVHAGLVMAVMGWVPLVWTPLTISLGVAYTAVKRNELKVYLNKLISEVSDFFIGSIEEREQARAKREYNKSFFWLHIGNWFNVSPLSAGKALFSIYILAIASMPWSMFMIYALYRPRTEIIQAIYAQGKVVAKALFSFYKSLSNVKKTIFILLGVSLTSGMLNPLFVQGGLLGLFNVGVTFVMLGLTVAGIRLGLGDFIRALSDPIKLLTNKMGILLGMIGGNRLAHYIFSGKISGILGPAYGAVESSGLFPSLYRMFFSANPYGHSQFYFANSFVGGVFSRMSTGVGGLFGSLFFSHDMMTYGTFHGVLGPTSYQLFAFMAMGAAVGYFIDKAVDRVSKMVKADALKVWENNPNSPAYSKNVTRIKSALNFTNHYRLTVTMTLIATGLFSGLRMPFYMSVLHTTASPLLSILCIEAALLLPALLATKLYRIASAQYQKYYEKKPAVLPEGVKLNSPKIRSQDQALKAALKTEREIEIEKSLNVLPERPGEIEAQGLKAQIQDYQNFNQSTKHDYTAFRSKLKHRKAALPKLAVIEEEEHEHEHEHESRLEMEDLEKALNQFWSFQDKEPEVKAVLIQKPQPVAFVFHPYRATAAVTPEIVVEQQSTISPDQAGFTPQSPKAPKLPAGISVKNILPENTHRRKTA